MASFVLDTIILFIYVKVTIGFGSHVILFVGPFLVLYMWIIFQPVTYFYSRQIDFSLKHEFIGVFFMQLCHPIPLVSGFWSCYQIDFFQIQLPFQGLWPEIQFNIYLRCLKNYPVYYYIIVIKVALSHVSKDS